MRSRKVFLPLQCRAVEWSKVQLSGVQCSWGEFSISDWKTVQLTEVQYLNVGYFSQLWNLELTIWVTGHLDNQKKWEKCSTVQDCAYRCCQVICIKSRCHLVQWRQVSTFRVKSYTAYLFLFFTSSWLFFITPFFFVCFLQSFSHRFGVLFFGHLNSIGLLIGHAFGPH